MRVPLRAGGEIGRAHLKKKSARSRLLQRIEVESCFNFLAITWSYRRATYLIYLVILLKPCLLKSFAILGWFLWLNKHSHLGCPWEILIQFLDPVSG